MFLHLFYHLFAYRSILYNIQTRHCNVCHPFTKSIISKFWVLGFSEIYFIERGKAINQSPKNGDEECKTKLGITTFRLLSYPGLEGMACVITVLINTALWQYIFIRCFAFSFPFSLWLFPGWIQHLEIFLCNKYFCSVNTSEYCLYSVLISKKGFLKNIIRSTAILFRRSEPKVSTIAYWTSSVFRKRLS